MSRQRGTILKIALPVLILVLAAVIWQLARGQGTDEANGEQPAEHTGQAESGTTAADPASIDLVDPEATAATRSLFAYLNESRGKRILFGHQHATTEAISADGEPIQSEVRISVGDYPAIFGWDTLSIEGKEKPGVGGNVELSRGKVIEKMQEAHRLGGIVALSTHFPNFVTGGSFNDTSAGAVAHILPGGGKNAEFNAFLDQIAYVANHLKDDNGELIPVLFRPFHEQNGSWFWWGARLTKTSDYVAIYRYTVEYLRDRKGVHNFLYVFSPNGPFNGDEEPYLTTYPGDAYVDVLGMDQYDNRDNPGTNRFLDGLAADLAMINRLADDKGKVAALSEFGYSPQGMKTEGNGDRQWFTKVLNAIKSDPDAKRTAYMQTWANFGLNGNLFVPYRNAPVLGDHELLPDFAAFYEDPYTAFAGELTGVYGREPAAAPEQPLLHIASPTAESKLEPGDVTVRARVLHAEPSSVTLFAPGSEEAGQPMTLDAEGYYSAVWTPASTVAAGDAVLEVSASFEDGGTLEQRILVRLGSGLQPASETLHDFEQSPDDWTINNDNGGAWNTAQATGPVLSDQSAASGERALRSEFNLGGGSFELTRIGEMRLDGAQALTAKVNVSMSDGANAGGGVRAKLFIKTGDNWAWADSGEAAIAPGGYVDVTFDLSNVTGKEAVRAIGVQILSAPDSSGTASVYLDDVAVLK